MALTTDQKGDVAETAIVHAAVKLGIGVLKPVTDGHRYDLIFDLGSRLLRVQCKWAPRIGDTIVIRCQSSRRAREGLRARTYTAEEIDAIAAYSPDTGRCYLVPVSRVEGRRELRLRLEAAKNNQRLGINWADLFEFGSVDWASLDQLGAIAQLGERVHGMHEVAGSSPASSTP